MDEVVPLLPFGQFEKVCIASGTNVIRQFHAVVQGLKDEAVTVFLTTHYMEEADRLCDRVAILDKGQIVALDRPRNLKQNTGQKKASLEDVFLALTGHQMAEGV